MSAKSVPYNTSSGIHYYSAKWNQRLVLSVVLVLICIQFHVVEVVLATSSPSSSSSSIKTTISGKKKQSTTISPLNKGSNKHNRAWINGIKNGICSAGASACSKTLLQPIDSIKTMQQYYQQQSGRTTTTTSLSIVGACKEIISRPGGVRNLYAGLSVNVIGAIPSVALYFGVYSYCKQRLLATSFGKRSPITCIATSAAIGNTIASFSRVPYEVLKQQLQTGLYASTFDALAAVVSTKGMFWNMIFPKGGIAIQMIRDVPYAVVTLLVYESLQTKFNTKTKSSSTSKSSSSSTSKSSSTSTSTSTLASRTKVIDFVVGGVAGGVGSYVTNPMDVIKTRLQTNSIAYNGSVWLCTQQLYNEGGIQTFLRGSIPRLVHKVPANAFFFFFYEVFRKLLNVE